MKTLDNRKAKIAFNRLKGHSSLWGENLQTNRERRGKEKIKTWGEDGEQGKEQVSSY